MPAKKKAAQLSADKTAKAEPIHPRVAFIRTISLAGIGLDKCAASLDRSTLLKVKDEELELELTAKQSVPVHELDHFIVIQSFELLQRGRGTKEALVAISASFSAQFNLSEPADESLVRGFANVEARLVFFPYLRYLVADLTNRMSIGSILLPLTSELERQAAEQK